MDCSRTYNLEFVVFDSATNLDDLAAPFVPLPADAYWSMSGFTSVCNGDLPKHTCLGILDVLPYRPAGFDRYGKLEWTISIIV